MKKPTENIIETLAEKKVLFLENSEGLYHGLDVFEELLIKHNIEYKCLFSVSEIHFDSIIAAIKECDAIVFQTTWTYDISRAITEHLVKSQDKKTVIECYISEPSWYYKPDAIHDVYICNPPRRSFKKDPVKEADWEFYKLSGSAYWNYENEFDK